MKIMRVKSDGSTSDQGGVGGISTVENESDLELQKSLLSKTDSGITSTETIIKSSSSLLPNHDTALFQDSLKLLYGAGGIYAAFLYYGSLQEDVFNHVGSSDNKSKFEYAWFLQVFEAFFNVIFGIVGWIVTSRNLNLPQRQFMVTGMTQVCSKAFTSLSLAKGLSFPVATLAKSAKMFPVMVGSLLLGGAVYSTRDYIQVGMIIMGTAMLGMSKTKGKSQSTPAGVFFILLSLTCDGITGGVQKKLIKDLNRAGTKPKPYDFMLFTNFYMMVLALFVSVAIGDFVLALKYCTHNPEILPMILKFSVCSAVGQSFVFYTVANFDPLVCTTVTTTRKIFSVLLSIFLKGHQLNLMSWIGVVFAVSGISGEVENKIQKGRKRKDDGN